MRRIPPVEAGEAIPDLMHRLRNPLAALKSGISLLRHAARPSGEALELVEQMAHEVERLDATTRETQRYFRLTAGRPRKVRIVEAARDARTAAMAEVAAIPVEILLDGGDDETVTLDPGQLLFSLAELMANACRQAPPGSRVRVSWRRAKRGVVVVEVADNGKGIGSSHAREIGRPYFTTFPERTGLGLATVARVCHLAGGSLGWRNVAGGGCRFTMELPIG